MDDKQFSIACEKELKYIQKQEQKLQRKALESDKAWKSAIESVIPAKAYVTLRAAFATAFTIIFEKGIYVIEKTYNKESLMKEFEAHDSTVSNIRSRRELRRFRSKAYKSHYRKSLITTAEGLGLGVLGIGLPDIVLFLGFILQSVYELALKYGYDYDKPEERMLILKMMAAAIQKRDKWLEADMEVEEILKLLTSNDAEYTVDFDEVPDQIGVTADVFALDMLVLKFIQGLPIVGIIGGLSNPIYYKIIMDYIRLKYHKRYLIEKKEEV